MCAPKIEPEIVFKVRQAHTGDTADAAAVLGDVEWLALGFEIIDCVYADWKFQPADFVAAYGLHAALIVGEPFIMTPHHVPTLVEELANFTVMLARNGDIVGEGSGRNSLRSPALCLGELTAALKQHSGAGPLHAGALVSSGTLTESKPIGAGETWTASVDGIALPTLTLKTV
jgi:2-keto-4-pentenoate hydratase